MNELLLVAGLLAALAALGGVVMLPWEPLLTWGVGLSVGGLATGVPLAVVYHVQLYRGLRARGDVPARWIWNPLGQHELLSHAWRRRVVPWAWAGGAGFAVVVLGLVLLGSALVSGWLRP